jgi:DNA repair protein RecN (Recombination protein N)
MLRELRIRDFAIIESLELEFAPGLTILSGETGAGKSILIDALALALGSRSSAEMVRTLSEQAEVEALFSLEDAAPARAYLEAQEAAAEEVLVRRLVSRSGRHRLWVNGRLATLGALFDLGRNLVDIYGQHEYQTLLQPEHHLELLDTFGGHDRELSAYQQAFARYQARKEEQGRLKKSEADKAERQEFLQFRIREIERVRPRPGEDEELKQERERLRHAEQLHGAARESADKLYEGEAAVVEGLRGLSRRLEAASEHDPALKSPAEQVGSAATQLEECARELRAYADRIEADPERLTQVDDRLAEIQGLKRKYGESIEETLALLESSRSELESLTRSEERLAELDRELATAREECLGLGKKLTRKRREAGESLARRAEAELKRLAMEKTRFEARLSPAPGEEPLAANGLESVEFFLSPNPGEELKPLIKIASGGELSRIMLALRTILAAPGGVSTLVFDEVDAGIGGATAEVVGRKLKELARNHQVLCVTHLPQIACYADQHYRVSKAREQGRTLTAVKRLGPEERVEELSRMLGGVEITETTRAHAREMMEAAGRVAREARR